MKAVLISIQPKWVVKIASGQKTIEVRKTAPKIETPFKCYIYMTSAHTKISLSKDNYAEEITVAKKLSRSCGKIIGEFICNKVNLLSFGGLTPYGLQCACLTENELKNYLGGKDGYGWHISDLKIYDKPKNVRDFYKPCEDKWGYCQACEHGFVSLSPDEEEYAFYHGGAYDRFDTHCTNYLTRPPQSWCYVEV